ncbi:MAG: hypothetical protein KDK70_04590 [Myxococcales bacterium]|nr:hypothetical protein [Myxococcales bacterium]
MTGIGLRSGVPRLGLGLGLAWIVVATPAWADIKLPDEDPDVTPPRVAIISPSDGDVLPAGEDVVVEVEASDPPDPPDPSSQAGVSDVVLRIEDQVGIHLDQEAPWSFTLSLDPGTYTLRATASDWEGNEALSAPVTITVGSGTTSSDPGSGPDPNQDPDGVRGRGCACASGHAPGWLALGPWLLVLGLRGRHGRSRR